MENFGNILIRNQVTEQQKNEIASEIEQQKKEDIDFLSSKEKELNIHEYFSANFERKLEITRNILMSIMEARGIKDSHLSQIIFANSSTFEEMGAEGLSGGVNTIGDYIIINIDDVKNIENVHIREMEILAIIAHELYHSTMKVSHLYDGELTQESLGAGYLESGELHDNALEEGLATEVQIKVKNRIFKAINQSDRDLYMDTIKKTSVSFKNEMRNEGLDSAGIFIQELRGKEYSLSTTIENLYSYRLIQYLREHIDNFDIVIEKARCERKTLDLARAIESTFGRGSYREITTATSDDAKELFEALKNRIDSEAVSA